MKPRLWAMMEVPGSRADLAVGSRVALRYSRAEDRLVGLALSVRP